MASENKDKYKEKAIHEMFLVNTMEGINASTWTRLIQGDFKKETKGMIITAENQTLRIRYIKNGKRKYML